MARFPEDIDTKKGYVTFSAVRRKFKIAGAFVNEVRNGIISKIANQALNELTWAGSNIATGGNGESATDLQAQSDAAAAANNLKYDAQQKKMKDNDVGNGMYIDARFGSVVLPVPENYSIDHTIAYKDAKTMAMSNLSNYTSGMNSLMSNVMKDSAAMITNQLFGSDSGIMDAYGLASGRAINQKITALFTTVEPRTFDFTYNFVPKTAKDCQTLESIIRFFRRNALPSLEGDGGRFLVYPKEFKITYGGQVGKWLHPYKFAVLTSVKVNYAEGGIIQFFENGYPLRVKIDLSFRESEIMTAEDVDAGY